MQNVEATDPTQGSSLFLCDPWDQGFMLHPSVQYRLSYVWGG